MIINDILDVSKIMSGYMRIDLTAVRVAPVVQDVVKLLSVLAQKNGLELTLDVVDDPLVLMDEARIAQVLKNLVGNAIKFTDSGFVRLKVYTQEGFALISIEDSGVGIPEAQLPLIFDKFYRVENIVHTKEGTGLGLALVRTIVHHHHGHVDVVSQLGVGSTFTVCLPLAQTKEGDTAEP